MVTKTQTPDMPVVNAKKGEAEPTNLEEFIQHQRKAFEEARKALMGLLPKDVQTHSEAAIKESIEGYRKLVNSTLDDVIEAVRKAKFEPTHKN